MKRAWIYNALAVLTVAVVASAGNVAFAEETAERPAPRPNTVKMYLDNIRNTRTSVPPQQTEQKGGYAEQVRQGNGSATIDRPIRRDDRFGTSTHPIVRFEGASTTRSERMGTTTKERSQERIKEEMKRLAERVLAAIHRLEELIVRIESRATKFDGMGANTTAARADIAIAKTELAAAKTDLATIQAAAISVSNASSIATAIAGISPARTAVNSARSHLRKAHEAIESAVKKLGLAASGIRRNATTTPVQ